MAAVSIRLDAIENVHKWVESFRRDIKRDIADLSESIEGGYAERSAPDDLAFLRSQLIILDSFDSVLDGIKNGGVEK